MKTFNEQYTRLPGRSKPLLAQARQQLYLAEDHILVVNPGAYSEESYRIALGDIQAVTMNNTNEFIISNFVHLAIMFAAGTFVLFGGNYYGLAEEEQIALTILFSILGAPFLVSFLFNLFFGPTCKCVLRTAVKQHHLSSLGRVRSAKKAIAMIAQAAYAQQGNFAVQADEVDKVDTVDSRTDVDD